MRRALVLFASVAMGCSGSATNDVPDLSPPPPDLAPSPPDMTLPRRDPMDHPPLLQVQNHGGPVIAAAEIYTIVWPGDEDLGAQVERFHKWMMTSDYWVQSLSEYGVGAGQSMGLVVLGSAAPATLDDSWFSSNIKTLIAAGTLPQPNANTLFAFVVPKNVTSTLQGSTGCRDYGGYHSETRIAAGSSQLVPYEVNLNCGAFGGGSEFDTLTGVLSHEAAEAATDPHPFTNPGWVNYQVAIGGEVSDLCVGLDSRQTASIDVPDAGTVTETYVVTRQYSQVAAKAGTSDPCVPAPARPYFNVGLDPTEWSIFTDANGNATEVAKIEPYSFGDVGLIKWQIQQPGSGIRFSPDHGSGKAGDTILLTATVTNARSGTYPIVIFAQAANGGQNQWFSDLTIQ